MKKLALTTLLAIGSFGAFQASAQEFTMRYSQHHSTESAPYKEVTLPLKEFIEKESDGRIVVETFPGGTLHGAADGFKALATDITDVAPAYPIFSPNSFHYAHGFFLPGLFKTAYATVQANEELYPEYLKPEYQGMGIELFFNGTSAPYQLLTSKPVETLDDLQTFKIGASGGAINDMVKALGATPVTTPSNELYTAFQQGVVDGVLIPAESFKTFHMEEVAKYYVPVELGRAGNIPYGLNRSFYESLPDDLKDVIYRAGRYGSLLYGDMTEKGVNDGMALLKERGVVFVEFSEEDEAKLDEIRMALSNEYIEEMNSDGYEGQEFFDRMTALGKEFGEMTHDEMVARQESNGMLAILPK